MYRISLSALMVAALVFASGVPLHSVRAANTSSLSLTAAAHSYLVNSSTSNLPAGSSARTSEAWIKTSTETEQAIFDYGSDAGLYHEWFFRVATGTLGVRLNGGNALWSAPNITDGNWHHVAIVYSGSGGIGSNSVAYMDNNELTLSSSVDETPDTYSGPFQVGTNVGTPTPTWFFDGELDEIRIWEAALSSTTLAANYDSELTGSETDLVGYWKFNDDLTDSTSNGNDLTLRSFSSDVPF